MKKLFKHTKKPAENWKGYDENDYDWDESDHDEYEEEEEYYGKVRRSIEVQSEEAEIYEDPEYYVETEVVEEAEGFAEPGHYAEAVEEAEVYEKPEYYGEAEVSELYEETKYYREEESELYEESEYYGEAEPAEESELYGESEYYGEAEPAEEPELCEESEYYGEAEPEEEPELYEDSEYYEEDRFGEDGYYQPSKKEPRTSGGFFRKLQRGMSSMSVMDKMILGTGVAVLVMALVTGSLYVSSRIVEGQVADFAGVGSQLDGINMIGERGLLASRRPSGLRKTIN